MDIKDYATYFQVHKPRYASNEVYRYKGDIFIKNEVYTLFMDYKDMQRVLTRFRRWSKYYTYKDHWILRVKGEDIPYILPLLRYRYTVSDCATF